jgi:hypothetical protein
MRAMKVVHGSLRGLLHEAKEGRVDAVRVAALLQREAVSNGMPRYTAAVVVTAALGLGLWTEWRLLVGRGYAEMTEHGAAAPVRIEELLKERTRDVRARVVQAGFEVRDGIVVHDAEALDGEIE